MPPRNHSQYLLSLITLLAVSPYAVAGDLNPPAGPVAPTMKTLDEVEPRTPIASLPFTIDQPGSYYLTGNLSGVSAANGISITASDVTLDLRGFRLMGVEGALDGINTVGALSNISIRNGTLTAWPGDGVDTSSATGVTIEKLSVATSGETGIRTGAATSITNCQVRDAADGILAEAPDCRVSDCAAGPTTGKGISCGDRAIVTNCSAGGNGDAGILVGNDATVSNCSVQNNTTFGIQTLSGCIVRGCTAQANGVDGIDVGTGSTVAECSARLNLDDGLSIGANCTVVNCTALTNSDIGIITGSSCTVSGCTATLNGLDANAFGRHGISVGIGTQVNNCTARSNQGSGIIATDACSIIACNCSANRADGIQVNNDCKVLNNNVDGNGATSGDGAGIHSTGADNRIEGNNATDNDRGIDVDAAGNLIIRNSSSGNSGAMNYKIEVGNAVGDVLNVEAMTITATNPWANFEY